LLIVLFKKEIQMKTRFNFCSILLAILLSSALLARPAFAEWRVNNQDSEFYFVTTKAGAAGTAAVQEVQTFKTINGKVDDRGNIEINVDLGSVDTGIPIRDQRIKEMLFNVAANPKATFTGKTDIAAIKTLASGVSKNVDLTGHIILCGQTKPISAKLRVIKLTDHQLRVETRLPLIINAADFGIQAGVEALRMVMGLNVLPSSAPVSFSVVLN
jgi:polyisoprenoid-binding protein YceI